MFTISKKQHLFYGSICIIVSTVIIKTPIIDWKNTKNLKMFVCNLLIEQGGKLMETNRTNIESLDPEWILLIKEAIRIGLTKEEVYRFLTEKRPSLKNITKHSHLSSFE